MRTQSALVSAARCLGSNRDLLGKMLLILVILGGIYLARLDSYLLFHSLADLFSVLVAFAVFIIAWHSYPVARNNYLLVLGVGSLFISILDILHVLGYHDMGVLTAFGPTLSSQLWIAARLMQAITVMAAPFFIHRSVRPMAAMLVYGTITALLVASIFIWRIFPITFVEGSGVTLFKSLMEYVVIAILVGALLLLWRNRGEFGGTVFGLLVGSVVAMIASEAMFTHYLSLTESSTIVGHLFKIIEFYLLYLAVVEIGLTQPYSLLFRQMKREDEQQIAEQKGRAEERAAELDAIFNSMTDGVILYGVDGSVLRANAAGMALFSYTRVPPELPLERRARMHGFIDEEGQPAADAQHTPASRALNGETLRDEVYGAPHGVTGELMWIACSAGPVRDASGDIRGAVLTFRDVTERKLAEEQVQQLNQELEHRVLDRTSQLEAANQEMEVFAYSVSHDVRPPLRNLSTFVELVQAGGSGPLDTRHDQYLDLIRQSGIDLKQLIDNLMLFSQIGRSRLAEAEVNLGELVGQVVQELKPQIEGRHITWDIASLPCVNGDRTMLRVVFRNLIANALEFTRTREHARIEIGTIDDSPREAVIYVRDNGVGFDMQQPDGLFTAMQRLRGVDDFGGTGIGLANVRRVISRHGGRTWVQGKPDEGATFYFSLPRVA